MGAGTSVLAQEEIKTRKNKRYILIKKEASILNEKTEA